MSHRFKKFITLRSLKVLDIFWQIHGSQTQTYFAIEMFFSLFFGVDSNPEKKNRNFFALTPLPPRIKPSLYYLLSLRLAGSHRTVLISRELTSCKKRQVTFFKAHFMKHNFSKGIF